MTLIMIYIIINSYDIFYISDKNNVNNMTRVVILLKNKSINIK